MAGTGGQGNPELDGAQRLLLDAMTMQMQRMLRENNEELYGRIEQIKHQMINNEDDHNGDRRRQDRRRRRGHEDEYREDRIEGVKIHKSNEAPKKTRSSDIKCFKCLGRGHIASECPTKRNMLVKDGEIVSESSSESAPQSDEEYDEEFAVEGDILMVRRLLGNLSKENERSQRENIFHTRCLVQDKVCSLIIDGGSCTNVVSSILVSKLNLEIKPHPRPYKL